MSIEERYIETLQQVIQGKSDMTKHLIADTTLCQFLEELGYLELVKEYKKINKSY